MDGQKQDPENVPSPVATGGGGERFEQRLGAFALALLLTRSTPPVLVDSAVTEVHFQTRQLRWCTDDVLIVAELRPGVTRKLAIQAKRSFTISESDDECVQTISGMWDDFIAAERFDPARDRLAIATLHGTATLLKDFASLLDCARAATSGGDFRRRLGLPGYLSKKAKAQNEALLHILRCHIGDQLDADRYWDFLRVLTVLSFDLGTPTSQTDAMVLALLAHVAAQGSDPRATASATWARLLDVASEGRQSATSYRRDSLPKELRDSHQAVPTSDERARQDLIAHGRMVRTSIRTQIARGYTIDRAALSDALLRALEEPRVAVVSGAAGSGKSAVARMLLDRVEAARPVLAFQAVEFATAHINETLSKTRTALNAMSLMSLLAAHDRTTILIDGVERLLEHSVRDALTHLLQLVKETPSLRLVMTCRDYSVDTVRSALLEPIGLTHTVVEVEPLSDEELDAVAHQVTALAPPLNDSRMRAFLRTPYLLDMASRLEWGSTSLPESVRTFRERCWRELVRDEAHRANGMPDRREEMFISIARLRATELKPYVRPEIQDPQVISALLEASLLDQSPESDKLYAPAHDVLEDWALLQWLDDVASAAEDLPVALAAAVGGLPAMRRGLRRWLAERLDVDPVGGRDLVLEVSRRTDVPQHFRDDCIVAVLLSGVATAFIEGCRQRVVSGDAALLRQVIHLLRVACKTVPSWLPRGGLPSALLVPTGPAWPLVLELVAQHMPTELSEDALLALGLAEDWARQLRQLAIGSPVPDGADATGQIVSALVPLFGFSWKDDARERALKVLLAIPTHAPAFDNLVRRALAGDRDDRTAQEFGDLALSTLSSVHVGRDYPDFVITLLRARLMLTDADRKQYGYSQFALGVDECFGMHEHDRNEFFPASALQGPFGALFTHHPRKALDFLLELSNHAAEWYGERKWPGHNLEEAERITIDVPGYGQVEQWFLGRLYALYRGMTVGPYPLQSALMALEEWLLTIATFENVDLESWLLHILTRGNSALTTAVVASVCVAHPMRAGRAALALLSNRDLFEYDRSRMAAEGANSIEFLAGLNPEHTIYEAERRAANMRPHRCEDLEALALRLQLTKWREDVWAIIDRHRAKLADQSPEEAKLWRLALHRMDMRGFRTVKTPNATGGAKANEPAEIVDPSAQEDTGEPASAREGTDARVSFSENPVGPEASESTERAKEQRVFLVPGELESDLEEVVQGSLKRLTGGNRHVKLRMAAKKAWENRRGSKAAEWRPLLAEARAIAEDNEDIGAYARGAPSIVAAACIRDRLDELEPDERAWCIAQVTQELSRATNERDEIPSRLRLSDAVRVSAAVVPLLVAKVPTQLPINATDLLVQVLTDPAREVLDHAYMGASVFLGPEHIDLAWRCAAAAAREATVLEEVAAVAREHHRLFKPAPEVDGRLLVAAAVRRAVTGSVAEAKTALLTLRFDTWQGRAAAIRMWAVILARSESEEARAFVARAAAWLAETWSDDRSALRRRNRDFHVERDLSRLIARFALKLTDDATVVVCSPLIALAAAEGREVATFLEHLIYAADGGAGDSFWAVWQAIADRAASAKWATRLGRGRLHEEPLINRLFLRVEWTEGTSHWARLDSNAHRVHALANRLPAAGVVAEAYLSFLYDIGRQELPGAFKVVHTMFRRAENTKAIFSAGVTYILETLLGLFVYGQPLRLKRDAALREAVLALLDLMVVAGSSAAYRMRDDFVTPLREGSA
ncbi:NACHT domain-containing protein [Pyxidicoccus xibeiensis]|uniref:NACHT domain-containing protein n=1 Tax=Pyxidicoccus xibeiensis TaxID=2906759 RepID=UPI0020A7A8E5|nr:NACHT domain-containing protein [Pyxidicoccus xibeiensis]MCP3140839.1 ATP-binding protein [Pyxidicoccus xibeiensis]